MRFQRIIESLYKRPLNITPQGFETLDAIVRPHLKTAGLPQVKDGEFQVGVTDPWGTPLPDKLKMVGNIAIISVSGPLVQHAALIDKSCGVCSYDEVSDALSRAQGNEATAIVLNFNSPGGEHVGCDEMAQEIAEMSEEGPKIIAFTDSQMASAAYCMAAGCSEIYATRSSMVGCIGSLMGYVDVTKAYEMEGLKTELFASGIYKGTGVDGVPLTEEQRNYLQGLVDHAASIFKEHVMNHRVRVSEESMQGQMFYGDDARDAGLIDEIVNDLEDVLELLR